MVHGQSSLNFSKQQTNRKSAKSIRCKKLLLDYNENQSWETNLLLLEWHVISNLVLFSSILKLWLKEPSNSWMMTVSGPWKKKKKKKIILC